MNTRLSHRSLILHITTLLFILSLSACSWNRAQFHEVLTTKDPDGTIHDAITDISHTNAATAGSRVEEGKGSVKYSGQDWSFALGNSAQQLEAADGSAILSHLLALAQILAPLLQPAPVPNTEPQTNIDISP